MNRLLTTALVAGGLMLLNSPQATAHTEVRHTYQPPAYYYGQGARVELRRAKHMPRWLYRNDSFRRWYRHTPLRRNLAIAWDELFDIYRWERHYGNRYERRYRDRNHDRHRKARAGHRYGYRQGHRHRH